VEAPLAQLERESGIYLDPEQREAVGAALRHKALILTGGPGTGKTTIIRFILGLAAGAEQQIALAAPTGKAAKRMAEATGHPASTIHRLLEAGRDGFARGAEHPIEADLVIIDESSMIDTLLMEALLEAIPPAARLVLVGDVDQLPSVGPGMVLEDLIASARFPVVRLERIHRQSQRSRITANAHRIRRGEEPDLSRPPGEELSDFYFVPESEPERIVPLILDFVTKHIPRRFELDPKADIQVLTPMHKGLTGAQNLNVQLQAALNASGEEISYGDRRYRVGDRVMQIRNDYDKDVFNGDVGEIARWDAEEGLLAVRFDEREVEYERRELDQLVLAYAITVHKAQGSEYPAVVLPLTTHHAIMLQRNLLYTAITRGRRLVVVIGTEKALGMAVRNARRDPRFTALRPRLLEALPARAAAPAEAHAGGHA
jgi:exodeoxyribonuclease V alpha subunit